MKNFIFLIGIITISSLKVAKASLDVLPYEIVCNIISQLSKKPEILENQQGRILHGRSPLYNTAISLRLVNRFFSALMSRELSPLVIRMHENKPNTMISSRNAPSNHKKGKSVWQNPSPFFPVHVSFWFKLKITDLERLFEIQPHLRSLNFTGSNLSSYTKDEYGILGSFTSLVSLEIYGASSLRNIRFLSSLPLLQELYIMGHCMSLQDLAPIRDLPELREFCMRGGFLENFDVLSEHTKLCFLDVSGNKLNTIDPFINLTNLTSLNVSSNYKLQKIDSISHLTSLKKLDLSSTKITELDSLTPLQNLEELELRRIRTLKSLAPLGRLLSLRAINLDLTSTPSFLFLLSLTNLQKLTLAEEFDGPYQELTAVEKANPSLKIKINKHDEEEGY